LAVRRDEIGVAHIELVDLSLWDKFINLNCSPASDCDGLEFIGCQLNVVTLFDLISFDDVGLLSLIAGLLVDLAIADTMPVSLLN
jgi:hypothetical protein